MKNVKMILFLLILASICTFILASAYYGYKLAEPIFNRRLYKVVLDLFEIESNKDNIDKLFSENFDVETHGTTDYYINKKNKVIVFKAEGPGLWSNIAILLAVNNDLETLYGLRVIEQAETPGLGDRITEIEFQESFKGIEIRPKLKIVKLAQNVNEVDAVSGASMTCAGLEDIINNAVKKMDEVYKK